MLALTLLSFISCAAGAVIERRDPVPAGYVAAPYYPGKSYQALLDDVVCKNNVLMVNSSSWRLGV
jgi:hypothetical protein